MAYLSGSLFYKDPPGHFSSLLQERDRGRPVSAMELKKSYSEILSSGCTRPFVYSVVRDKDEVMVGYLVGTNHYCNKPMLENPSIQKVMSICSFLFMERLPSWYDSTPPCDLVGRISACPFSSATSAILGMNILMDNSLCAVVRSRGIDCQALETEEEHEIRDKILKQSSSYLATYMLDGSIQLISSEIDQETFKWLRSRSKEELTLEMVEYYQRGCSNQMHRFMLVADSEILKGSIFKPNLLWTARSIIPAFTQLKEGTTPICVMVGLNHLLGQPSMSDQTSIIKILRSSGFKVTRILSESDIAVGSLHVKETPIPEAGVVTKKEQKISLQKGQRWSCTRTAVLVGAVATVALSGIMSCYLKFRS